MKFCFDTVCVVVVFEKFLIPCTIITIFMMIPFLKLINDCTFFVSSDDGTVLLTGRKCSGPSSRRFCGKFTLQESPSTTASPS